TRPLLPLRAALPRLLRRRRRLGVGTGAAGGTRRPGTGAGGPGARGGSALPPPAHQPKEADPHPWALPRLSGTAKAAMVEIQADEYGAGIERDMHQTLFAVTMSELGLDTGYNAYLPLLPGVSLATTNLVSYFGLHRRLRGAL